jgi:hypothetical protein
LRQTYNRRGAERLEDRFLSTYKTLLNQAVGTDSGLAVGFSEASRSAAMASAAAWNSSSSLLP